MNTYKSSATLKSMAKGQLLGKYGTMIGANVLSGVLLGICYLLALILVDRSSMVGTFIYYAVLFIISLFSGIIEVSKAYMNLKLVCGQEVSVSDIFYGFKQHPDKAILIQLYITIITFVLSLPTAVSSLFLSNSTGAMVVLFIGILSVVCSVLLVITSLLFSQVFYLVLDFPQYSAKEVLRMSIRLMRGNKGRLFYLIITFLPLYLSALFSCCITLLWVTPYVEATKANFYMDIVKKK